MNRAVGLIALAFAAFLVVSHCPLERVVQTVVVAYVIVAGFSIMLLQQRAWPFVRQLLLLGIALMFLPALFAGLAQNLFATIRLNSPSSGLFWAVLAAFAAFVIIRLVARRRRHAERATPRRASGEKERVLRMPEHEDEWE
jgi:hypothetical protein